MGDEQTVDLVEQFGLADTVVVTDNLNRALVTRGDRATLDELRTLLAELGEGWHVPPGGVPIAKLRLNFQREGQPMGNLSVGKRFLAAHVFGTFLARDSDLDTAERLLGAVGADHLLAGQ
jgi:hypothetical protein